MGRLLQLLGSDKAHARLPAAPHPFPLQAAQSIFHCVCTCALQAGLVPCSLSLGHAGVWDGGWKPFRGASVSSLSALHSQHDDVVPIPVACSKLLLEPRSGRLGSDLPHFGQLWHTWAKLGRMPVQELSSSGSCQDGRRQFRGRETLFDNIQVT